MNDLIRMKGELTDAVCAAVMNYLRSDDGKRAFGPDADLAILDTNTIEVRFLDPFDGRRAIQISIR